MAKMGLSEMKGENYNRLKSIVEKFSGKKILIIGDLILDEFIWGSVNRISPEAPVPVVWVENESFMPGGAANVANNVTTLGGKVYIAGIIGNDERGAILKSELEQKGVDVNGVFVDESRPTTLKTRVIAHRQQVVRIDKEKVEGIKSEMTSKMVSYIKSIMGDIDGLIIEDYGKGVVSPALLKPIISCARKKKKIISVDPKEAHFSYYKGVTVITPNNHEAANAVRFAIKDDESLKKAGEILLKKLNADIGLITLGEKGMAVFEHGKPFKKIPTVAQEVFDVSGAGDTVISCYTLSLVSGADAVQAAYISNCAAGIVVGKVGISVVNQEELINRIKKEISIK